MKPDNTNIDRLIEIVKAGGVIKTGVNVYNKKGLLLLNKDISVSHVRILTNIKKNGVLTIPIDIDNDGGMWDKSGKLILSDVKKRDVKKNKKTITSEIFPEIKAKIKAITELKKEASKKYNNAKTNIKTVLADIKKTGGKFDFQSVEHTVNDLLDFLTENDNAFSYIAKEIFSYDDYLYSHSTNVCTIGSAVLNKFNTDFANSSHLVSDKNKKLSNSVRLHNSKNSDVIIHYTPEEMRSIAIGYFLHDVGKVLIPDYILNKKGKFTDEEFAIVKTHSYEKSVEVLKRNKQQSPFILNAAKYHHSALFKGEKGCYPDDKTPAELPAYVKICKFADIYDAMTSKRCYKDAFNPIGVVTNIFREYVGKDNVLQTILRSFVQTIGICPPGSIVYLKNGQMAYIIDSAGPLILPFTDFNGKTLSIKPDVVDLGQKKELEKFGIDDKRTIKNPADVSNLLPAYLKEMIEN
ncbi:MAG: hypothetical protein B6I31_05560 [Desulfobacteraceae bacterium 4572_19]|nr:MAG: hypothetical protein B6I31_05560 [Desulfobacteraceae bacterium 4572_19]